MNRKSPTFRRHVRRVMALREAINLERARGHWTVKHAAAVAGVPEKDLLSSDCPRLWRKGRTKCAYFEPATVRQWMWDQYIAAELGSRHGS